MSNLERNFVNYVFDISEEQAEALLELALRTNRSFNELIREALDAYLEREKKQCLKP